MRVLGLGLFALSLCCGPREPPGGDLPRPILAASPDTADTAVFLLELRFNTGTNTICTATLVSPRVLLTAAHCVDPAHQQAQSVVVRAMNKPDIANLSTADFIDVTEQQLHPSWTANTLPSAYDIAVLLLASAPSGVAPRELARTGPTSWVNQPLRLLGYGRTNAQATDSGTRRSAVVSVTRATTSALEFGAAGQTGICAGDSGGPGLWTGPDGVERVATVHSYTLSASCGNGGGIRVDRYASSFIDPYVASKDPPTCAQDGRCRAGCVPVDLDCACAADGTCNPACPNLSQDPDCPLNCGQDGVCAAATCPVADPDCGQDGDVCTKPGDCAEKMCVSDPRGFSFCTRTCLSDDGCTRSMVCNEGACRAPPTTQQAMGEASGGCSSGAAWPFAPLALVLLASTRRLRFAPAGRARRPPAVVCRSFGGAAEPQSPPCRPSPAPRPPATKRPRCTPT